MRVGITLKIPYLRPFASYGPEIITCTSIMNLSNHVFETTVSI